MPSPDFTQPWVELRLPWSLPQGAVDVANALALMPLASAAVAAVAQGLRRYGRQLSDIETLAFRGRN